MIFYCDILWVKLMKMIHIIVIQLFFQDSQQAVELNSSSACMIPTRSFSFDNMREEIHTREERRVSK